MIRAALAAALVLAACASRSDVERRGRLVLERTDPERLDYCPPEILARARAAVAFARAAAARGEALEAARHLDVAERAAREVEDSPECRRPVPEVLPPAGDTDDDGVIDSRDRCPDAAEDLDGFVDEDGCPDVDDDGDGLSDVIDKCPREAEDLDGFEDLDGCPERGP